MGDTTMNEYAQSICHKYIVVIFRPCDYMAENYESADAARIRLHKELCKLFACDRAIIEEAVKNAAFAYSAANCGVSPYNDYYIDLPMLSDMFVAEMEKVISMPENKRHPKFILSDSEIDELSSITAMPSLTC